MLSVCLPGTGGMLPLPGRYLACCLLEYQGKSVLIDCGEGTQMALRAAGCRISRIERILITHLHADHLAGLPGLLLTIGNTGRTEPLLLAGPPGLYQAASALMQIAPVPYPVQVAELAEGGGLEGWAGLRIRSLPLKHGIPCYGYRCEIERKPVFNPQKAERLGIPKEYYRRLHAGESVRLPDGRTVEPQAVLEGERPPLAVCYCTDTLPIPDIAGFAKGADLFIAEGMYGGGDAGEAEKRKGKMHSTFPDSAWLAAQAGVRQLWLTHFSPALADPQQELEAARALFPQSVAAFDGIRLTLGSRSEKAAGEKQAF
ncbi:MAG: ribonuclease Z [Provencibacterium sp.]|jgi:ribonuclease Z|nr:ribonuclease Z [Provencibacterium sp.]